MSFLSNILRNRRVKRLAREATNILADNQDLAFETAIRAAADAAGLEVDPVEVKLAVCELELAITTRRLREQLKKAQRNAEAAAKR